jgi:hypothetical protein
VYGVYYYLNEVNSITFYVSSGNFATGTTISLYGVK